ncbi:hypothetical protein ACFO5K_20645 [Nocardia halotolerans]|uniref:Uncharacterized protein n=1 Tax=Nocardia halotolerans TaxID=1755878 RepID=A0ABV8VKA6_9NOCA
MGKRSDTEALDHYFSLPHFERVAAALDKTLAEPFTLRRLTSAPT